ncbi:MAG: aldolase/citrate lyase family protein [Clostridiales bacterium]|nr:aldolase/citrate lyase family protein [Clostridiales bacterium]
MDHLTKLKNKLENNETVFGITVTLREPAVMPHLSREGLDFILFDLEHGPSSLEQIGGLLQAARGLDIPTVVRVQDALYHLIAKTIDLGADGIMLPRTETLEQVETAIGALRFAPVGRKGFGGSHQFRTQETFDQFQANRLLILQIESPRGVASLPDILARYNEQIAGIVIGPYDLSVQVGTPLEIDSALALEQIRQTMAICREFGLSCGIYCDNLAVADRWRAAGMNILWVASELDLLDLGIGQALERIGFLR